MVVAPPERELLAVLLALASAAHLVALLALRQQRTRLAGGLASLGQLLLLAAMVAAGLRALAVNEPLAWLPVQSEDLVETAAWLVLLVYLLGGYWWRSPGLGVTLPLATLPLAVLALVVLPVLTRDVLVTRGLPLALALRPAYGAAGTGALALAVLGLAGAAARWLERRALGAPCLAPRVVAGLLTAALLFQTGQLALAGYAWATRPRGAPVWTLQQTWLVATWLVLALTSLTAWRGRRGLTLLAGLSAGLLLLGVALVAGTGPGG
jgi:hypothetical protein